MIMILTLDIGNTNIVVGGYRNEELLFTGRLATEHSRTEDEYAVIIGGIIGLNGFEASEFEGSIISSVVPPINSVLKNSLLRITGKRVIMVSPGMKTGLNIRLENPAILGADMVCTAVAAIKKYSAPCVVFDLGTATTISAIDSSGAFLGGSIAPGPIISLKVLSSSTAQLPVIDGANYNGTVIGANTPDAMRSGVILGTASMIDGMLRRYREVLGEDARAIVTGGVASSIIPHCESDITLDRNLLTDGLRILYYMNTSDKR